MRKTNRIFYLCDGEKPDCKKITCYKKKDWEGVCRHTSDIDHAINFEKPRHPRGSYREKVPENEYPTRSAKTIRYALESYVDAKDEWYWKRINATVKRKHTETVTLAVVAVIVSGTGIIISTFSLLHKSK